MTSQQDIRADDTCIAVLDFETTGTVKDHPNIPWQIGIAVLVNGRLSPKHQFESWLRVGPRPFNPYAPGRHAEVRGELAAAPRLQDLWARLQPWLAGRPLCAHNVSVERKVLTTAFPMHRFGPWLDTLTLARCAYPGLRSHALGGLLHELDLVERLHVICPNRAVHDALYDAVGCALVLEHLLALPGWSGAAIAQLQRLSPRHTQRST